MEERLMSTESRLDGMQTRFNELTDRIVDISRMGNIMQLFQTLARVCGGGGGAAQS